MRRVRSPSMMSSVPLDSVCRVRLRGVKPRAESSQSVPPARGLPRVKAGSSGGWPGSREQGSRERSGPFPSMAKEASPSS